MIQVSQFAKLSVVKGVIVVKVVKVNSFVTIFFKTTRVLTLTTKPGNRAITTLTTITTGFAKCEI